MKKIIAAALGLALSAPVLSQSKADSPTPPLPPQTPLVVEGKVRVDAADFEGNMLRIPENRRGPFRMSHDRVAAVIDNVFVTRSIAQKARDAGMENDPAVQARLRQVQDAFLADLYVAKLEKEGDDPEGLQKRAHELYIVDPKAYATDEEVQMQQILISTKCRTKDAALEIARQALAQARAPGADFIALAARFTDETDKAGEKSTGELGWSPVKAFVPPVREAVAKMKKGEISEPVESPFGIHVLKLVDRKPAQPKPYDKVKDQIVAAERGKLMKKRVEDLVSAIRNSTTVVTYSENVDRLVAPGVDVEELSRRAREATTTKGEARPQGQPDAAAAVPPAAQR